MAYCIWPVIRHLICNPFYFTGTRSERAWFTLYYCFEQVQFRSAICCRHCCSTDLHIGTKLSLSFSYYGIYVILNYIINYINVPFRTNNAFLIMCGACACCCIHGKLMSSLHSSPAAWSSISDTFSQSHLLYTQQCFDCEALRSQPRKLWPFWRQ